MGGEAQMKILPTKLVFCHRNPDRTLKVRNKYFPVCARCMGIYVGVVFAFLIQHIIKLDYNLNWLFISLFLMLPTAVDGITQSLKWRESRNSIRLTTGLIAGIGYGFLLMILIR